MAATILKISLFFIIITAFTLPSPANTNAVSMSKFNTTKTKPRRVEQIDTLLQDDCQVCNYDVCDNCWNDGCPTQKPCEECGTCPTCEPCFDPTTPEPCHCTCPTTAEPCPDPCDCPTPPPCTTPEPCWECPSPPPCPTQDPCVCPTRPPCPPPRSGYPRFSNAIYQSSLPSWPTAGTTVRLGINATTEDGAPLRYRLLTSFEFLTLSSTNDIIFISNVSDGAFVGPNNVMIIEVVASVIGDESRESGAAVIIIFPRSSKDALSVLPNVV